MRYHLGAERLSETVSSDIVSSLRDGTVLCRVAEILYPSHPIGKWIEHPAEYMDYNVNITIFGDHCADLGIEKSLIIDYTIFDDNDVARLTTCLFEYIEHYNRYRMSQMPSARSNPSEDKQVLDTSYEAPTVSLTEGSGVYQPELSDVREVLLPSEQSEGEEKCCCCCFM